MYFFCLFISLMSFCLCFALTLQPGGIVLLCAQNMSSAKAPEEGRVSTHKVGGDAGVQLTIYTVCTDVTKSFNNKNTKTIPRKGKCSYGIVLLLQIVLDSKKL